VRFFRGALVLSFLAVVAVTVWAVRAQKSPVEALPVYGQPAPYTLVDQAGQVFSSDSMRGKVAVINFIFTSCPSVCPLLTSRMKSIQEATVAYGNRVQLVSISVDPEHDTPAVLKAYGLKYGADFSRWAFLTGPLEELKRVIVTGYMNAMGTREAVAESGGTLFDITHGQNFVLVDSQGQIRAFRRVESTEDVDGLVRLVGDLLN
jgi:protein SCO1